jgi:hypothetical protein
MEDYLNYDYLWQLCQKEKQTNQLLLIPKTFYEGMAEFISVLDQTNEKGTQMKANATKMLDELFESRKQKILLYIAHSKPLPQPANTTEVEFYDKITDVVKSCRIGPDVAVKSGHNTLKSLVDIPEIILPSGSKIGPLKKDQHLDLQLPESDLSFLLANSICANL